MKTKKFLEKKEKGKVVNVRHTHRERIRKIHRTDRTLVEHREHNTKLDMKMPRNE
jgi:hypothetical protein